MVKLTIKTVITLAAAESACGEPLFKTGIFGTVYIIMTFYVRYMDRRWRFFDPIKKSCLSTTLFTFAFMSLFPLVPLSAIALILNTVKLGRTAGTYISVLTTATGLGCFVRDCIRILHPCQKN